ncbi:cytochrome c oxidase subunit 3 [Pseudoalteromonas sp. McH1-7]|uniref:cytochrome-c oxidase n=1 Tax=Pseudoalteromonas peptidolytica F12-50-A1 TaxID=1315280 RepID=A0A8I0MXJ6_9GAMM|nr:MULTISPECIES: cytochrome c oxidase subunit 3 [Pseudoalteromonas]MBE0347814.1 cytochrome c oxidase subunit III [Pseudoalteromonas peptidolytica F12-50-A1]MDW7551443.1 cytochrome c oxidase subunit 3 [Pseudoalteromonas peptidolytica]NLR17164.1 cytochrome c oxidase subunit 3 [Pseudoalteromonas peptidolytica]NUZ13003.1 cytochrome c oxidase subunit 3 [Pseudoalteromonas sp. McH1-7]RRS07285.1 cytochrome c oxidase subunit 3 [Pseudoalteromonas sp. J010]
MNHEQEKYYVPEQSPWPIVGAFALFFIAVGCALTIIQLDSPNNSGAILLLVGIATLIYMIFGWFRNVIQESQAGLYSEQMDRSFKQGMGWFIFSEIMFFGAFFGALFYARMIAVPWLGGASNNVSTNEVLWPQFEAAWPLLTTPDGTVTQAMGWQGLPLINTIILLASSITLSLAHVALEKDQRAKVKAFLGLTVLLGIGFLTLQVEEYIHAYQELGLTLQSGVYGNTFFLLTGFHGVHVTLGAIILFVIWVRVLKGHFSAKNHFAFQAGAWYWHFVDVVWLCLFVFVYVL